MREAPRESERAEDHGAAVMEPHRRLCNTQARPLGG
jgi:hypothetical protein